MANEVQKIVESHNPTLLYANQPKQNFEERDSPLKDEIWTAKVGKGLSMKDLKKFEPPKRRPAVHEIKNPREKIDLFDKKASRLCLE